MFNEYPRKLRKSSFCVVNCDLFDFGLYFRLAHADKVYLVVVELLFAFNKTKFAKKGLHFYKYQNLSR